MQDAPHALTICMTPMQTTQLLRHITSQDTEYNIPGTMLQRNASLFITACGYCECAVMANQGPCLSQTTVAQLRFCQRLRPCISCWRDYGFSALSRVRYEHRPKSTNPQNAPATNVVWRITELPGIMRIVYKVALLCWLNYLVFFFCSAHWLVLKLTWLELT